MNEIPSKLWDDFVSHIPRQRSIKEQFMILMEDYIEENTANNK
jgi:hypothetical protein